MKSILEKAYAINLLFFITAFIATGIILLQFYTPIGGSDFWMHAGHVRFFSENIFSPMTNYDEAGSISVRNFAPWQFMLANMKNLFNMSTVETMQVGSVITLAVILIGLWLVGPILSDSPFAQVALLITVFFVIGSGFLWSEEIHIHSLFLTASFPSTITVGLGFLAFYFTNNYLQQPRVRNAASIVLIVALMLLTHQMVFMHFMAFLFFWVVLMAQEWKQRLIVFALFTLAIALSMLWPYFNPIEISYAAVTGADTRWDGNFSDVKLKAIDTSRRIFFGGENFIQTLGLAISSYALVFFIKNKIRWPLLVFALFCTFMWHFGRTLHLPTSGYRWAMPTIFALQFIFAHHLAFAFSKLASSKPQLKAAYVFSCILVLATGLISVHNLRTEMWKSLPQLKSDNPESYTATQELILLTKTLAAQNANSIIFADHRVSYALVGLDINPVIFSRKHNHVNSQLRQFYSNELNVEEQKALLTELRANVIIIDKTKHSEALINTIESYSTVIAEQGRYTASRLD